MNSIEYNENKLFYPLTHPQKRIWYIETMYFGTSLYNIGGPVRIKGTIDFNILEESINIFIKKNEGTRLRLVEQCGEVKQYISNYERIKLDYIDFSQYKEPEAEFKKWADKEARKPFLLDSERLFYFALFKISDNDNGYLVKFHHIISDGWSINIMTEQICNNYMKLFNGEEIDDSSEYSYTEYIDNEKKYLSSNRFLKNKFYWNEKFKVFPDTFLNNSSDNIEGKRKTFELDSEVSSKIKDFTTNNKFSLNTFFVALYLMYLYKTTQREDIVLGTPVLNRSGKKEKNMFGMFTSTIPFRFVVDDNKSVLETMNKVNEGLITCYFNQKYPYDLLVQDLELKKKGYDNLFNICINYYNTKLNKELNGFPVENVEFYNGKQVYSMQLVIKEWYEHVGLTLEFDYKVNDYSDEQINDIYDYLSHIINQIIGNPNEKVQNLTLLNNDERIKLLYEFNDTESDYPKNKTIHQLFEEQVKKTPDKLAISFDSNKLTYNELNQKSNQLARYLVKKGVKKEDIVGLLTTNSIETIIGILGILKAGGAYLPIDPIYPNERIHYMLKDSRSTILLTNQELHNDIGFNGEIIDVNNPKLYVGDVSNLELVSKYNDLVYIIYTSGSTGNPKGTMIENKGLVNYIWWAKKVYVNSEDEVFPLYSSLAFDLTVTSIFTPLISGNKIIVYSNSNEDDEYVLYRIIKENKATIIKLTPSQLSLLKDIDNRYCSVKKFIVGGEDLKVSLAKNIYESFDGNIEIFNEYGPTETVVGCMIHKYNYEKDTQISVPIGTPADNVQIYILDKNCRPVPPNIVGELYISGDGVARGYLNRLELTQNKFVENPFRHSKIMYKTGDSARFIGGNKIEYTGRLDKQVKMRGYRIELGEIEKYLVNHKAVKDAVVIDIKNKNNGEYLCAYIVKKAEVTTKELKDFLKRYLPDYMIPIYFIDLNEIPLTINGKFNRELLPKPELESITNSEFIKYRNEKEKNIVNAISKVLNIEIVSVRQNFYHLGGDSIKAIQIASKLNDKGFKIKVKDILSYPIIEEMALCVEPITKIMANQELCEGNIKQTPINSWFFSQRFSNLNYYNQSLVFELKHDIETEKLDIILNELIKHHDSLRINYNSKTRELYYNNDHVDKHYKIEEHDLSGLSKSVKVDRMKLIAEKLKASFNIEGDILIKACAINFGKNKKKLIITMHHLVVDGVSLRILLDDINTMIKQINSGQKIMLSLKTDSYQKWADMLEAYATRECIEEEKKYWNLVLSKKSFFPIDYDFGADTVENSNTISVYINENDTERLISRSNTPYNTEPKDLLITSLLRTIKQFTGNEEIIIELEGHGREDIFEDLDITRTVGWFTNIYPFYVRINSDDLAFQIKTVKEELRNIPNNGTGFGILKYLYKSLDYNHQKYIRFNYLGDFTTNLENDEVKLLSDQIGNDSSRDNHLTCILDINCYIVNGRLNILLTYSKNKFSKNTIDKFMNSYINNLNDINNHCCDKNEIEFTPSDFDMVDISEEEMRSLFN